MVKVWYSLRQMLFFLPGSHKVGGSFVLLPLCSRLRVVVEACATAVPSSFKSLKNSADSFSRLILKEGVLL